MTAPENLDRWSFLAFCVPRGERGKSRRRLAVADIGRRQARLDMITSIEGAARLADSNSSRSIAIFVFCGPNQQIKKF